MLQSILTFREGDRPFPMAEEFFSKTKKRLNKTSCKMSGKCDFIQSPTGAAGAYTYFFDPRELSDRSVGINNCGVNASVAPNYQFSVGGKELCKMTCNSTGCSADGFKFDPQTCAASYNWTKDGSPRAVPIPLYRYAQQSSDGKCYTKNAGGDTVEISTACCDPNTAAADCPTGDGFGKMGLVSWYDNYGWSPNRKWEAGFGTGTKDGCANEPCPTCPTCPTCPDCPKPPTCPVCPKTPASGQGSGKKAAVILMIFGVLIFLAILGMFAFLIFSGKGAHKFRR